MFDEYDDLTKIPPTEVIIHQIDGFKCHQCKKSNKIKSIGAPLVQKTFLHNKPIWKSWHWEITYECGFCKTEFMWEKIEDFLRDIPDESCI